MNEKEIQSLVARVEKVEGVQIEHGTRIALAESDIKTVKSKLDKIENNTSWILKLIVGAIVLGLLGLLFQGNV